jgi:hypothetical protein
MSKNGNIAGDKLETTPEPAPELKNAQGETLEQTTVTFVPEREIAAILLKESEEYARLAYSISDKKATEEIWIKDFIRESIKAALKADCGATIARWQRLVKDTTALPMYEKTHTHAQVEEILKGNARVRWMYDDSIKAKKIKDGLPK